MRRKTGLLMMAVMVLLGASLHTHAQLYVTIRPNAPVYDRPVCPGSGYLWVDGEWLIQRGRYIWQPGYWALPPAPGYVYAPGRWHYSNRGYVWSRGSWGPRNGYRGRGHYYHNRYRGGHQHHHHHGRW